MAGPDWVIVDLARDDARWESALSVLQELRPHLDRRALDSLWDEGWPQGLRFLAAMGSAGCLGVAGWRLMATTYAIRKLYVDDLVVTAGARSLGVGHALLAELERRAREAGCACIDLDSGVQRFDAHRFYLRERMVISSHHFSKSLTPPR